MVSQSVAYVQPDLNRHNFSFLWAFSISFAPKGDLSLVHPIHEPFAIVALLVGILILSRVTFSQFVASFLGLSLI
ncbi:hypothetical protein CASFOL_027973 [Castilleja foliolosa]|uniref:Uncharacterized protein n=1 Tax=Castilleja foliolosa TaxID=1961234 RepID=A0ABD3CHG8_9LAMI